jgi:ubiquinol oxidase
MPEPASHDYSTGNIGLNLSIILKLYSKCMFDTIVLNIKQLLNLSRGLIMKITHKPTHTFSDKFAYGLVKFFRFFADTFFRKRYGNRAIVLETVAAVPGMVGGALQHLNCLRKLKEDHGWIKRLLDEADNERMHLMTFLEIAKPNWFERMIIFMAQAIFVVIYLLMYVISTRTAHRFVGYLEEEAVISYNHYLTEIDEGRIENCAAPAIAIEYWNLPNNATLREVVIAVGNDEVEHRDVNHYLADQIVQGNEIFTPFIIGDVKGANGAVSAKD